MLYTAPAYRTLCAEAWAGGHTVKLSRDGECGWGLQLVVPPGDRRTGWRAVGVLFPELEELDQQAQHLLGWLRAASPASEAAE